MKTIPYIATFLFTFLVAQLFSQVDSSYVYIVHLTVESDSSLENSISFAIASNSDTLVFKNQREFYPVGVPKNEKIDLLIFLNSNTIKIEDITSLMKFELWHYLNLTITDFSQECMFATFWNKNGEQISANQNDAYLNRENKMNKGVSCHYSEFGSYYLLKYLQNPPECILFGK